MSHILVYSFDPKFTSNCLLDFFKQYATIHIESIVEDKLQRRIFDCLVLNWHSFHMCSILKLYKIEIIYQTFHLYIYTLHTCHLPPVYNLRRLLKEKD